MCKGGVWPMVLLAVLWSGDAGARGKRAELTRQPRYEVHHSDLLPRDMQVSTFLNKGHAKRWVYFWIVHTLSTNKPCLGKRPSSATLNGLVIVEKNQYITLPSSSNYIYLEKELSCRKESSSSKQTEIYLSF